jgi:WD40 repeat protein
MKWLVAVFILILNIQAEQLKPYDSIEAGGNVIDMVVNGDMLVVGTDKGSVESYNISTKEKLLTITFPMIKDFMGDDIYPKVFSVDFRKISNKYLAVVQATNGFRELYTIQNGQKKKIIDVKEKLFISKAKFIDENRVIIALLSNEYILFDINKHQQIYRTHISYSHFSDFMLNEDKSLIAGSSESGKISIINVETGKVYKTLQGANVDNVYKVDFKKDKVLGAGQDRRGVVYDIDMETYSRFDGHFLIYAGALSPSAKKAAFAFTEQNDIVVFDLFRNKKVYTLRGQKSTLNSIVFIDENTLVSGSDDKNIMLWKFK